MKIFEMHILREIKLLKVISYFLVVPLDLMHDIKLGYGQACFHVKDKTGQLYFSTFDASIVQ